MLGGLASVRAHDTLGDPHPPDAHLGTYLVPYLEPPVTEYRAGNIGVAFKSPLLGLWCSDMVKQLDT